MSLKTIEYIVEKDDNLWNIVKAAGFPPGDWKKIYHASYNRSFKQLHPDPNRIFKGDILVLPKYGPNSHRRLMFYVGEQETALKYYQDHIRELEREMNNRLRIKTSRLAYLAKLKREAVKLKAMGDMANDECTGDWEECLGAGMYAKKMFREARNVMRSYKKYEVFMQSNQDERGMKELKDTLSRMKEDERKTKTAIGNLKTAAAAALAKPY